MGAFSGPELRNQIETTVIAVVRQVAAQRKPDVPPVERHQTLSYDLGLRSLDLAQLIATLEMELQADPFAKLVPITSVRTVGDFCDAYVAFFEDREEERFAEPES